ncbi:MAG: hypothetical protein U0R50_00330 [Gaiellales bacterium]
MSLPLSRAVVTCVTRRLAAAFGRAPLVVIALAIGAVVLPVAAYLAARGAAAAVGAALVDVRTARLVLAGFAIPAVAGGVALGAATSGRRPDSPLVASPAGRLDLVIACALVPAAMLLVGIAPAAVATLGPVVSASPGGARSAPAVAGSLAAAIGVGMVAPRAVRRLARGVARVPIVLLGAATVSAVGALCLAGDAVAGVGGGGVAAFAGGCAIAAAIAIGLSVPGEPAVRERRSRSWRVPGPVVAGTAVATLAMLSRRREVVVAGVGAPAIGATGLTLALLAASPPPAGALIALGGVAVVLAPIGLVPGGLVDEGRWLWQSAPVVRQTVASAIGLASLALWSVPVVVVLGVAAGLGQASPVDSALLLGFGSAAWLCAWVAGVLAPWARAGHGAQAVSLGAFAVVAGLVSLAAGQLAPLVPGAPAALAVWGSLAAVSVVGATAAFTGHLGRST